MKSERIIRDLRAQLNVMYEEKCSLHNEIGVSDVGSIVAMVKSLEQQVVSLYAEKDRDSIRSVSLQFGKK